MNVRSIQPRAVQSAMFCQSVAYPRHSTKGGGAQWGPQSDAKATLRPLPLLQARSSTRW